MDKIRFLHEVLTREAASRIEIPKIALIKSGSTLSGEEFLRLISGEEFNAVRKADNGLSLKRNKLGDKNSHEQGHSPNILATEVCFKHLAPLSFVDVPPLKGLSEKQSNAEFSRSLELANRSVKGGKFIYLLILSETEDLNDNLAISLIRDYDPKFERTMITVEQRPKDAVMNKLKEFDISKSLSRIAGRRAVEDLIFLQKECLSDKNAAESFKMRLLDSFFRLSCSQLRGPLSSTFFSLKAREIVLEKEISKLKDTINCLDQRGRLNRKILIPKLATLLEEIKSELQGYFRAPIDEEATRAFSVEEFLLNIFQNEHKLIVKDMDLLDFEAILKGSQNQTLPGFLSKDLVNDIFSSKAEILINGGHRVLEEVYELLMFSVKVAIQRNLPPVENLEELLIKTIKQYIEAEKANCGSVIRNVIQAQMSYLFSKKEDFFLIFDEEPPQVIPKNETELQNVSKEIREFFVGEKLRQTLKKRMNKLIKELKGIIPRIIGHLFIDKVINNIQDLVLYEVSLLGEAELSEFGFDEKSFSRLLEKENDLEKRLLRIQKLKAFLRLKCGIGAIITNALIPRSLWEAENEDEKSKRKPRELQTMSKRDIQAIKKRFSLNTNNVLVTPRKKFSLSKMYKSFKNKLAGKNRFDLQIKLLGSIPESKANSTSRLQGSSSRAIETSSMERSMSEERYREGQTMKASFVLIENYVLETQVNSYLLSDADWLVILEKNSLADIPTKKLKINFLHDSFSTNFRPSIWALLADVKSTKSSYPKGHYESLIKEASEYDWLISKDIDRTFPYHEFFKKQEYMAKESLQAVLRAYANFDKELGYTQGMNYIVGNLLIVYSRYKEENIELNLSKRRKKYESDAFWTLVFVMGKRGWRDVLGENTPNLWPLMLKTEADVKRTFPHIYQHMLSLSITPDMCFSQYILTILNYAVPNTLAHTFMDIFLLPGGEDTIQDFLNASLQACQRVILECSEMDSLFRLLKASLFERVYKEFREEFFGYLLLKTVEK